ncbi:MAG TPA: heme-binding protein [Actinomycetota bacterium]
MTTLTLQQAAIIIDAGLARGRERGFEPLTIAVLDPGGHPLCLKREDGSGILRPQIAVGKAWGALGMGYGSREVGRRAADAPVFFSALFEVSGGRMLPAPGGVLVRSPEGELLGAVGVTGDNSDNDELCALAGIEAAGLVAQPAA